jgi:hypothetical protein
MKRLRRQRTDRPAGDSQPLDRASEEARPALKRRCLALAVGKDREERGMVASTSSPGPAATEEDPTRGRWWIAGAAVLFQLALGAVYAWSVFGSELQEQNAFDLTKTQAALPFSVTIGMIFLGTYLGGRIQDQRSPAGWCIRSASCWPPRRPTRTSSGCSSSATA